jgi:hypothetical protein
LIITTTERIEGKRVIKVHGLARANSVRARHVGHDIMAAFRNLVGGEVAEYSKLLADSRGACHPANDGACGGDGRQRRRRNAVHHDRHNGRSV